MSERKKYTPKEILERLYISAKRYKSKQYLVDDIVQEAWKKEMKAWNKKWTDKALWFVIHRTVKRAFSRMLEDERTMRRLPCLSDICEEGENLESSYKTLFHKNFNEYVQIDNIELIESIMKKANIRKRQKEYIRLSVFNNISCKEISKIYNNSESTVRYEIFIAQSKMKEYLEYCKELVF